MLRKVTLIAFAMRVCTLLDWLVAYMIDLRPGFGPFGLCFHQDKGQPPNCHVYFRQGDGGYYYYFAPAATTVLGAFMKYWEGFEISEPTNLGRLEVVI